MRDEAVAIGDPVEIRCVRLVPHMTVMDKLDPSEKPDEYWRPATVTLVSDITIVVCFADHTRLAIDRHSYAWRKPLPDYAHEFRLGAVTPDGSIWLSPETLATAGVVEIAEAEAAKAERFGWQRMNADARGGYVMMGR
jgi:hypothetical protein